MPTVSFNTHFPDYEILGELGRGNARVLKARHLSSGNLVAIKQFAFNTDAETLRRFQQESEIMTAVDNPNVVKVREIHLDAPMPYLVMEFVEGGDLRGLLKQASDHNLAVPDSIRLGLQMAQAFRAIHPKNIVHRDIKPENILYRRLVSGELHFLLTDFGIAKIRAEQSTRTVTGQSLLTYEYAAPEQFDDPRQVGIATDYYSLGVVLYECLTGRVPFPMQEGSGLAAFMKQVLTATPPAPTLAGGGTLPPSLATLLRRMLDKNSRTRLQDAGELELLLEQAKVEWLKATHAPPSAAPRAVTQVWTGNAASEPVEEESGEEVYKEESRPNAGLWWVVAAVVAAAAFGIFWYQSSRNVAPSTSAAVVDSTAGFGDTTSVDETIGGGEQETEARPDTATVNQASENELDTSLPSEQTETEPTPTAPTDASPNPVPAATDSTQNVTPPDTTR